MSKSKNTKKPVEKAPKKSAIKRKAIKKKKPVEESISIAEQIIDAGLVLDACGNDEEVAQFFLIWMRNGRNATKAYLALHPHVQENSACIMGGRLLGKVNKSELAKAYGITYEAYFKQLHEGMTATKEIRIFGQKIGEAPDHKTRRDYHKAAGEILGIETKAQNVNAVQVNVNKALDDWVVTDK